MSNDPYDKYAGPEDKREGRQTFGQAMKDPFLANLWSKIHSKPDTPKPAPKPCIRCGAMLEHIPKFAGWITEPCEVCGRHQVIKEATEARQDLIRRRVKRDLGKPLKKLLSDPRRALLERCAEWVQEGYRAGDWIYLHGPGGRGKTSQALSLAWEIHRMVASSGEPIVHEWQLVSLEDLSPDVWITYATTREIVASTKGPEWRDVAWWEQRHVLIIDEVGRDTSLSETDKKVLERLYDSRHRMDKTTILISNYHLMQELPHRNEIWGDETLHQRILQRCGGLGARWVVDFKDQPNWRLR